MNNLGSLDGSYYDDSTMLAGMDGPGYGIHTMGFNTAELNGYTAPMSSSSSSRMAGAAASGSSASAMSQMASRRAMASSSDDSTWIWILLLVALGAYLLMR